MRRVAFLPRGQEGQLPTGIAAKREIRMSLAKIAKTAKVRIRNWTIRKSRNSAFLFFLGDLGERYLRLPLRYG